MNEERKKEIEKKYRYQSENIYSELNNEFFNQYQEIDHIERKEKSDIEKKRLDDLLKINQLSYRSKLNLFDEDDNEDNYSDIRRELESNISNLESHKFYFNYDQISMIQNILLSYHEKYNDSNNDRLLDKSKFENLLDQFYSKKEL